MHNFHRLSVDRRDDKNLRLMVEDDGGRAAFAVGFLAKDVVQLPAWRPK